MILLLGIILQLCLCEDNYLPEQIPDPVHVYTVGTYAHCGFNTGAEACNSIEVALDNYPSATSISVGEQAQIVETQTLVVSNNITISGESNSVLLVEPLETDETIMNIGTTLLNAHVKMIDLRIRMNGVFHQSIMSLITIEGEQDRFSVLELLSISFEKVIKDQVMLHQSLLNTVSGRLVLSSCSFKDITLETSPLLHIATLSNRIEMSGTNSFNDITRHSGGGSIFNLDLNEASNIQLQAATFQTCRSLNGNGGAISINSAGGTIQLGSNTIGSNLIFKNCSAGNDLIEEKRNTGANGNGGAIYIIVLTSETSQTTRITLEGLAVTNASASSSGGGLFISVEEGAKDIGLFLKDLSISDSNATEGSGGGIYVSVANKTSDIKLDVSSVLVSNTSAVGSSQQDSANGSAMYINLKSDVDVKLKSVMIERNSADSDQSLVYVAITSEKLANDADIWSEIKTKSSSGDVEEKGSSSVIIATQTEDGTVIDTKTSKDIIAEKNEKNKSYWWIVFPLLAFVIIIVVLVILDYLLVCRKEQEGEKSQKYEEQSEKGEEMVTDKYEEETDSELAHISVPSVSEQPDDDQESGLSSIMAPSLNEQSSQKKAEEQEVVDHSEEG